MVGSLGVGVALAPAIGCRITDSGNTSITNNSATIFAFDTERFDTDTMHDPCDNTKITVPSDGIYAVYACIFWAFNNSGYRRMGIRVNGTTFISSRAVAQTLLGSTGNRLCMTSIWLADACDYFELEVFQNSGVSLNVLKSADFSPEFSVIKVN